jgi:hypothetical protein
MVDSTEMYMVTKGCAKMVKPKDGDGTFFIREEKFDVNSDFGMNELLGLTNPANGREYTVEAGQHGCKLMYLTQGKLLGLCTRYPALKAVLALYCKEKIEEREKKRQQNALEQNSLEQTSSVPRDPSFTLKDVHQHLKDQHHLLWLDTKPVQTLIGELRETIETIQQKAHAFEEKMELKMDRILRQQLLLLDHLLPQQKADADNNLEPEPEQ